MPKAPDTKLVIELDNWRILRYGSHFEIQEDYTGMTKDRIPNKKTRHSWYPDIGMCLSHILERGLKKSHKEIFTLRQELRDLHKTLRGLATPDVLE